MTDTQNPLSTKPTMPPGKRLLIGLVLSVSLAATGLIAGGIMSRLFVTAPGFDGLADVLGFIMLGILGGFVVGVILSATLSPGKLIVALKVGLVAGVLSVALVFVGIQRKNRAIDETMRQHAAPRQTTAPAVALPTREPTPAVAPPDEPVE